MTDNPLDECARALEDTGEFLVLRKISIPTPQPDYVLKPGERIALAIDTETTGLDPTLEEVIEIGAVAFSYSDEGGIGEVLGTFEGLREPTVPITPEITTITGITPDMVAGKVLDLETLNRLVESAALIIAHNAAFDRPFCERISSSFVSKHWACSATEIPWRDLGYEGIKLAYLLYQTGYFHDGHRALDDAVALMRVLDGAKSQTELRPLSFLLEAARKPTFRIEFEAPYELRLELRKRGYRWTLRPARKGGVWRSEIDSERVDHELAFVRSKELIIQKSVTVTKMTALNRFRD